MGIKDPDTDPSTPGALRGLSSTDPMPNPVAHVSTDPGLGPQSQPALAVAQPGQAPLAAQAIPSGAAPMGAAVPMGIVVPAASAVKPKKDSVELLLEGMQGPQPQRPRTTPQTDGESHAAYHAKHQVHAARTSPEEEPKVVVERPNLSATTRIDRSHVQAAIEQGDARREQSTAVLPQRVAPRMVLAVIAGLAVVMGLFVVLRLATKRDPVPRPSVHAEPATVASVVTSSAATSAPSAAESAAVPLAPTTPAATETETAPPPATAATASVRAWPGARPKAPPKAAPKAASKASPSASGVDLGDYQTQLH
jgi:hypothetical protein